MKQATRFTLKDGTTVTLVPLTVHEMVHAFKEAGTGGPVSTGLAATREALALALREVNDEPVDPDVLGREGVKAYLPRQRHRNWAADALGQLHAPTDEEIQHVLDRAVIEEDGDVEVWTITLPDGRKVALAEIDEETVGATLDAMAKEARSGGARELLATLASLRRSIRSVDGAAVRLDGKAWDGVFSLRETQILKAVWTEMHGLDGGDASVGEAKPVPGTP